LYIDRNGPHLSRFSAATLARKAAGLGRRAASRRRAKTHQGGGVALIAILVDADACPVKDEVYAVASRHRLAVAVVSNTHIAVPRDVAQLVVVGREPDAADDWIAGQAQRGDVVVTADIPLASRVLAAGARALRPDGRVFDESMIGDALATRQLMSELRDQGAVSGGPRPLSNRDRERFVAQLDRLVQMGLRDDAKP
jgi:uncharacterized protein YaiI (UPF0178 family)